MWKSPNLCIPAIKGLSPKLSCVQVDHHVTTVHAKFGQLLYSLCRDMEENIFVPERFKNLQWPYMQDVWDLISRSVKKIFKQLYLPKTSTNQHQILIVWSDHHTTHTTTVSSETTELPACYFKNAKKVSFRNTSILTSHISCTSQSISIKLGALLVQS